MILPINYSINDYKLRHCIDEFRSQLGERDNMNRGSES